MVLEGEELMPNQTKIKKPLEREIQKSCIDFLNMLGIFNFKINNGGVYIKSKDRYMVAQTKGIADLIVFPGNGRTICIEFKTEIGRQSADQAEFQRNCEKNEIDYWIIRSVDVLRDKIQGRY
ncbi:MAG: hypothetical protein Q8910_01560 [Bacteroidota bacterium]|nr:hypothetical protein [Bacteroidota bacterium]